MSENRPNKASHTCALCESTEDLEPFEDGLFLCADREACILRLLCKKLTGK